MADQLGRNRSSYALGIFYLLFVVLLWTLSAFIMNSMFLDLNWPKPFLTTYLATSSYALYLLGPAYSVAASRLKASRKREGYEPISTTESTEQLSNATTDAPQPLTVRETSSLALVFCFLWFAANWASNAALGLTTVSSVTILVSTSGFFTLAVGSFAGVETFSLYKLIAVFSSVLGVILVSKSDTSITPLKEPLEVYDELMTRDDHAFQKPRHPLLGDLLALISAFVYALYVTLLKVRIPHPSQIKMSLFFGFVGLYNIILFFPLIPLIHYLGLEPFVFPRGAKLWTSILINSSITFISDLIYVKALLLTSPVGVTLGLSLTIPLAVIGDLARGVPVGGFAFFTGAALVLGGFVAVGILDNDNNSAH